MRTSEDLQRVIKKFRQFAVENYRIPNVQEIADLLGYASTNSSDKLLKRLEKHGYIERVDKGKYIPKGLFALPILGSIPAGSPVEPIENTDKSIDLYRTVLNLPPRSYVLVVKGESMRDCGIVDGDLAVIDPDRMYKVGDIVAACIDNDVTLKRLAVDGEGTFYLKPENKADLRYKTLYPQNSLDIRGVLIQSFRGY